MIFTEHKNMSVVHGFFVSMGGFVVAQGTVLSPIASHEVGTLASAEDIVRVRDYEIFDRSKGDEVTKGLAMLQTAWFIAQCVARRIQRLPLTELEVITLAFGAVNLVIYIIWWEKPLDVRYPIRIGPPPPDPPHVPISTRILLKQLKEPLTIKQRYQAVVNGITWATDAVVEMFAGQTEREQLRENCTEVPTLWAGRLKPRPRGIASLIALFLAIGFGAIHCIAWNLSFPTPTEQLLWRIASITVMAVPIAFYLDAIVFIKTRPPKWYSEVTFRLVIPMGTMTYIAARGLLMVLAFTALRTLPPDVYKDVSWAKFMPHIS
jgi:hypothetical protein